MKNRILLVLLFFIPLCIFGQDLQSINERDPKWQIVLGGTVVGEPQLTSYGSVFVLDGRMVTAITKNGLIYWQKNLKGKPSPFFTVNRDDFVYTVSDEKNISFFNPSGILLWEKTNNDEIVANLKCGWDGRVFVPGKKSVSCYGLDGNKKWEIITDLASTKELCHLPDGSLLFFMQKKINNCSTALRISPYGRILEEIVFTGIVTCTLETEEGVLLGFENGNVGCCSVKNNTAESIWTIPIKTARPVNFSYGNKTIFVLYSDSSIIGFNIQNSKPSKLKWQVNVKNLKVLENVKSFFVDDNAIFITNDNAFSISANGKIDWHTKLEVDDKYLCLDDGFLVQFGNDWVISSYLINQKISLNNKKTTFTFPRKYPSSWLDERTEPIKLVQVKELFLSENYGIDEIRCIKALNQEIDEIYNYYLQDKNTRKEMFFKQSIDVKNTIITLAGMTGTWIYTDFLVKILEQETDFTLVLTVLESIKQNGYDYNGSLLLAIDNLVQTKANYLSSTQKKICDAVFSVCKCMGKPAIFSKGKQILSRMNTSGFDSNIRDYARTTLQKIIALQI